MKEEGGESAKPKGKEEELKASEIVKNELFGFLKSGQDPAAFADLQYQMYETLMNPSKKEEKKKVHHTRNVKKPAIVNNPASPSSSSSSDSSSDESSLEPDSHLKNV